MILYVFNNIPIMITQHEQYPNRVTKCDITKTKICELKGFVEILRAIKTKNVFLLKIGILLQIVSKILSQLCSND